MKTGAFTICSILVATVLSSQPAAGQFEWTKDSRNPIMTGAPGTWYSHVEIPCVLFNPDSGRYEMWFVGGAGTIASFRIGYARSGDGISWQIHPDPVLVPTPGAWDAHHVESPFVMREDSGYTMYFMSYLSSTAPGYIGMATSMDGVTWVKDTANPILGPGAINTHGDGKAQEWTGWEGGGPTICCILRTMRVGVDYDMWYGAVNSDISMPQVGHAVFPHDTAQWKRDSFNPVVSVGPPGTWDDQRVNVPIVVPVTLDDGVRYLMFYRGGRSPGTDRVGLAYSSTLEGPWTKWVGNPILTPSPGQWDGTVTTAGSVLIEVTPSDTVFHMWYSGAMTPTSTYPFKIGHATSSLNSTLLKSLCPADPATGADDKEQLPSMYALSQNYPNPFNPSTTIRYGLPVRSHVTLAVFNTLGQQVGTLVHGEQEAGYHEAVFDATGVASGVYLYRLQAGSFVQTKRMLILK